MANPDSLQAGRARLQCTCGGVDQDKNPRLQRVFLNSTGLRPQAESGQHRRRDGYDLRIFAGTPGLSMLAQLRSTGGTGYFQASAQVAPSTSPPAGAGLNSITAPGIEANQPLGHTPFLFGSSHAGIMWLSAALTSGLPRLLSVVLSLARSPRGPTPEIRLRDHRVCWCMSCRRTRSLQRQGSPVPPPMCGRPSGTGPAAGDF
jgi:hypothetical protein